MKSIKVLFDLQAKGAWRDYLFILLGAAVMGLGLGVFLIDAKVVPGGVSGLSMTVHYLSGGRAPVGVMMWVFNIPLFIWGVKALGKEFDPNLHEAVRQEAGKEGTVIEELQKGYKLHDRVIRPTMVVVGNGEEAEKEE